MAELGVFTSCLQIIDTALKLKKLWSEIHDGPKDLQELVEEVIVNAETLGNLRKLYESPDYVAVDGSGWENCHQLFRKAAESLNDLVDDLQALLKKHRRTGPVRLYMRSSDLTRCKERFQRAQMIMLASQQAYSQIFAVQNFSLILRELRTMSSQQRVASSPVVQTPLPLIDASRPDTVKSQRDRSQARHELVSSNQLSSSFAYRLELPHWLTRKALQLHIQRTKASWGLTLRIYNRVRADAPVFKAADSEDWMQVQKLFATGEASPFDINPWGRDLLVAAAEQYNYSACRMLVSHGLSPYRNVGDFNIIHSMAFSPRSKQMPSDTVGVRETISLSPHLAADLFRCENGSLVYGFWSSHASVLELIMESVDLQCERSSVEERVTIAFGADELDVSRLKVLLGPRMTLAQAFDLALTRELDFNHLDMLSMVSTTVGSDIESNGIQQSWLETLEAVIKCESCNSRQISYRSSLTLFLQHYYWANRWRGECIAGRCNQYITETARCWIALLKAAGANLERYGAAERVRPKYRPPIVTSRDRKGNWTHFQIQNIVSGPDVEDWKICVIPVSVIRGEPPGDGPAWVSVVSGHAEYEMAGHFWDWIENPELYNIPGGYDSDDGPDDSYDPFQAVIYQVTGPIL